MDGLTEVGLGPEIVQPHRTRGKGIWPLDLQPSDYVKGKPDNKMMNTPGINGDHIKVEVFRKGEPLRPR